MTELTVALVQPDLHWEDRDRNYASIESLLGDENVDLIVLPEMFPSGFSMNAEHTAEDMSGPSVCWMRQLAQERNCVVAGSVPIREGSQHFNRLLWVSADGVQSQYDKRHLIGIMGEDGPFTSGVKQGGAELGDFKFSLQVCYDLRFPVWSRNTGDYDVLLYCANWPTARADAWSTLLKARAIENQSYVIGVNRVGVDPNGTAFCGRSVVYDPLGERMLELGESEAVGTAHLSREHVNDIRERLPFLVDRDRFTLDV